MKDANFALVQKSLLALSQKETEVAALLDQVQCILLGVTSGVLQSSPPPHTFLHPSLSFQFVWPRQVTLDEADVLMKYVYRGLQRPDNSAFLLKLHAQLVEKCGLGK